MLAKGFGAVPGYLYYRMVFLTTFRHKLSAGIINLAIAVVHVKVFCTIITAIAAGSNLVHEIGILLVGNFVFANLEIVYSYRMYRCFITVAIVLLTGAAHFEGAAGDSNHFYITGPARVDRNIIRFCCRIRTITVG